MAVKFEVGSWVKYGGWKGLVTGHFRRKQVLVRWIGNKRATRCNSDDLTKCSPPRALVLEGSLDKQLHSQRSAEGVLRTWLRTKDVLLAYKNIHSLEDIDIIGRAMGTNIPAFVHISCHGEIDEYCRPYIAFAPKPSGADIIYLDAHETINVFRTHFQGLPVLFSACLLGKYQKQMVNFRDTTGISQVAAFTRPVCDSEAIIFELLVYHGILENGWSFTTAIDKANKALSCLLVKGGRGRNQALARVF